jgi:aminomethyltransferase
MCYPDGGIVDDLLVYKISDKEFLLVVNASNIDKDYSWMKENNKFSVSIKDRSDDYSLLAIQGPNSVDVIQKLVSSELNLEYYHFINGKITGVDMIISRTGYTGEIGYELYFKGDESTAEKVWNEIFSAGREFDIQPVGLAARDSLRLEMGYCLYGNDIDKTTNPIEAGLGWVTKLDKQEFIGKDVVLKAKLDGTKRKLVAMISDEKIFPRHGYEIIADSKRVGVITSGTVSPVLEKPIALGYVDKPFNSQGSEVAFKIRDKEFPARITKLPFVKK